MNLRLDRTLSVSLMRPLAQMLGRPSEPRVPILMYHGIGPAVRQSHRYFETNTPLNVFTNHMQFLSHNGYRTASLDEVVQAVHSGYAADKQIAITFDDGYRDFCTQALPVLTMFNFTATVFVVPRFADNTNLGRHNDEYMSWDDLHAIRKRGMKIGSHTMTHPRLYTLRRDQIDDELRRSKDLIQHKLGVAVHDFAYPFAFPEHDSRFTRVLRNTLQDNGYRSGVCTVIGRASAWHDVFFLPRLPMNAYDDLRLFDAKLKGGYDWVHGIQYSAKCLKARFT